MATLDFTITRIPRDIKSVLGLSQGDLVFMQNIDRATTIRAREQSTQPGASEKSLFISPGGERSMILGPEPFWFWSQGPGNAEAEAVCNVVPA